MTDRIIKIVVTNYENSKIFCNLILEKPMKKEDMDKNKAIGKLDIIGLSLSEAKNLHLALTAALSGVK